MTRRAAATSPVARSKSSVGAPRSDTAPRKASVGTPAVLGLPGAVRRKYGNVPTTVDGKRFASKREATRYQALVMLERAGEIRALECQPRYPLVVNGIRVGTYVADFVYATAETGELVVEDAKGVRTRDYILKSKLLLALYGHRVREV